MKRKERGSFLRSGAMFLLFFILLFFPKWTCPQNFETSNYPSRPITYIVPIPPGSSTDLAIRLITKEAEKYLKQPIVPVNRPGGALTIGTAAIATSKPDGYTIGHSTSTALIVTPQLEKVPYDPIKDLRQIMQYAGFNFGVFVRNDSPFKDLKDIINYGRQNPKKLTFGLTPLGMPHFLIEKIMKKEKIEITVIPFKGAAEIDTAVLGGHVLVGASPFNYSLLEARQTRLLLLMREERSAEFPEIPILKDLGYDIPCPLFTGVQGPKGISEGILRKIEQAFTKAMKEPAFINGMKELHLPIIYRSNTELTDYLVRNFEAFGKIIEETKLTK